MDRGKLFIGGISWDTNEDSLREHFAQFGAVVEAVIMRDRSTGRARGFGFVVFDDPAVAERVALEKHTIDGRTVDVKKAVPRDDPQTQSRKSSTILGSLSPARTKKIFVGGLPSTITESDFKKYFDQFGTVTDVVVMYDHNTQRPRGFGFITYDSEDAVDNVLLNTFHDLNGKKVEVKRAVPKELTPGPSMRLQSSGYNTGLTQGNSLASGFTQGYNPSSITGNRMGIDDILRPLATRYRFSSFNPGNVTGMDYEPTLSTSILRNATLNNFLSYGRALDPYFSGNSSSYNSPAPYGSVNQNTSSHVSSIAQNVWGDADLNYGTNSLTASASMPSGRGALSIFDNSSLNWGSSPISSQIAMSGSSYCSPNLNYTDSGNIGLGRISFERRMPPVGSTNLTYASSGYEGSSVDLYSGSSVQGDPTLQSSFSELDGANPFSYMLGNPDSDVTGKGLGDIIGGYNVH